MGTPELPILLHYDHLLVLMIDLKAGRLSESFSEIKDLARLIPPFLSTPFLLDGLISGFVIGPRKGSTLVSKSS